MPMHTSKKLRFVRKTYGRGWTPSIWQGWCVVGLYVVIMMTLMICIEQLPLDQKTTYLLLCLRVVLTGALLTICYWKGESPKRQWGGK